MGTEPERASPAVLEGRAVVMTFVLAVVFLGDAYALALGADYLSMAVALGAALAAGSCWWRMRR